MHSAFCRGYPLLSFPGTIENKMAFGGGGVVAEVGEEIACPICFEEFEEPKCLPNCAHNVCYECLKGMTQANSKKIECPVCRKESKIPSDGVAGFPKNHLLARLIEGIPGRKEKKVISKALKDCKEKMEVLRSCLTEMDSRFETTRDRAKKMREEVQSAASLVVDLVREQEKDLLGKIDRYMSENHCEGVYSKHKENLGDLLAQGCSCSDNVQELLDRDEVSDLKDLQQVVVEQLNEFVEASETRIFWAEQDTKSGFGLTLSRSEALQNFIQEGSLGTIQRVTGAAALQASSLFDQSGHVIRRITSLDIGQTEFSPFAVAVSKDSGNLAVLDESKKRVYIMNLEGERQANNIQIQYGDLWDVAYSKDDEVVVVNRSNNRLLHYNCAGKFERKVVYAPGDHHAKFTFLSVDSDGRYLVTSAPRYEESAVDTDCFVCVYSPDREHEKIFGDVRGELSSPKKAIWDSGEFFVPDSDRKSVVVFDERGIFQREIGCGELTEPAGIAIDSENDNILVCDYGNDSIQIFKTSGTFVTKFDTEGSPVQIALSKDGKKIVLCCEGSGERFLQVLSYIPTL